MSADRDWPRLLVLSTDLSEPPSEFDFRRENAERLLDLAFKHGLLPLVAERLLDERRLPAAVRGRLIAARLQTREIRARQWAVLRRIRDTLDGAGIPWVLMGGFTLAETHYPGAARVSSDLDLLVAPCRLQIARFLLHGRGARPFLSGYRDLLMFEGVKLDLHDGPTEAARHASLSPVLGMTAETVLARRRLVTYAQGDVWEPACDDRVLLLSLHAVKHGFERLVWCCDLYRLTMRPPAGFSWQGLADRARGLRVGLGLWLALQATAARYPMALPAPIANLRPRRPNRRLRAVIASACSPRPDPRLGDRFADAAMPGLAARIRHAAELVLPRRDVLREWSETPLDRPLPRSLRWRRARRVLSGMLGAGSP